MFFLNSSATFKQIKVLQVIWKSGKNIREIFLIQLQVMRNVTDVTSDVIWKLITAQIRGQGTPVDIKKIRQ